MLFLDGELRKSRFVWRFYIRPLILAAVFSLSGFLTTPPAEIIWAAQYFIAIGIGVKYVGISSIEIRDILAGLIFSILLLLLTTCILALVLILKIAEPVEAILSFAPGGQVN